MDNIICDSFSSKSKRSYRFRYGIPMSLINTEDIVIKDSCFYDISTPTCCSFVKDTKQNCFYLLKEISVTKVKRWLNEISPIFPSLSLQLIETSNRYVQEHSKSLKPYMLISHSNSKGGHINIKLKLSKISVEHYGYTNSSKFEYGYFKLSSNIFYAFLEYLKEENLTLEDEHILTFLDEKFSDIIKILEGHNQVQVSTYKEDNYDFLVYSDLIIDTREKLNKKDFYEYMCEVCKANKSLFQNKLKTIVVSKKKIKKTTWYLIQALYSKKTYTLEAYLAHILIRALYTKESDFPFITQYYKIKEKCPDLYFWNLIFLTQFGFDVYYYYWLTKSRTFKFIDEKYFLECAKSYQGYSADYFFENYFKEKYPTNKLNVLSQIYKSENFLEFLESINLNFKVIPTESFKNKSKNFFLSKKYTVGLMIDNYYYIEGDDYRFRKYKKSNFITA